MTEYSCMVLLMINDGVSRSHVSDHNICYTLVSREMTQLETS